MSHNFALFLHNSSNFFPMSNINFFQKSLQTLLVIRQYCQKWQFIAKPAIFEGCLATENFWKSPAIFTWNLAIFGIFQKSGNFLAIFANLGTILAIFLQNFNQKFFWKDFLKKYLKNKMPNMKNCHIKMQ